MLAAGRPPQPLPATLHGRPGMQGQAVRLAVQGHVVVQDAQAMAPGHAQAGLLVHRLPTCLWRPQADQERGDALATEIAAFAPVALDLLRTEEVHMRSI